MTLLQAGMKRNRLCVCVFVADNSAAVAVIRARGQNAGRGAGTESFGSPPYIPLLLLYHTGMRISEVLGLSWSDIDFAAN